MDAYVRGIKRLSQLCGVIAAGLIALAVAVVCDVVVERYLLGRTTIWQTDFVTYATVAATFIGSPYVLMTRGHVNVDVLPLHVGPRTRYWLALFTMLLAMSFCVTAFVLTAAYWHEAWANNWRSATIWRARLWIPYSAMPIGLGVLTAQYVAELINLITGREPPFGITKERTHA